MSLKREAVPCETAGNSVSISICVMSSDDFVDLKLSDESNHVAWNFVPYAILISSGLSLTGLNIFFL